MSQNRTGIIYHPDYLKHETGFHPENKERLLSVMSHLKETGIIERLTLITPERAELSEVSYIHTPAYIEKARKYSGMELMLDIDTVLSKES
ncbi:MAG TPA: histone deacetylase, partial [Candidatus Methanoperedens sp.]